MDIDELRGARRIAVIGSPGAGKSTLARLLATAFDLPLVHLDQIHWQAGWVELPGDAAHAAQAAVVAEPRWVIDGNYSGTLDLRLARADAVVWLDLPTALCLTRAARRVWTYRGRTRPDMTPGCPERFDFAFFYYIARFRRDGRPRLVAQLADYSGAVLRVSTRAELDALTIALADR